MKYLKKFQQLHEYYSGHEHIIFEYIQNGHIEEVKKYLEDGGNPNRIAFDDWSLLMYAKNYEIAKLLIDYDNL